jgi:hypothetical protein
VGRQAGRRNGGDHRGAAQQHGDTSGLHDRSIPLAAASGRGSSCCESGRSNTVRKASLAEPRSNAPHRAAARGAQKCC